jgi:hypothetical protein
VGVVGLRGLAQAEGERPGALADLLGLRVLGDLPRALAEQRQGSGEPGLITERLGAVPGFLYVPSNRRELAQRHQGVAESDRTSMAASSWARSAGRCPSASRTCS